MARPREMEVKNRTETIIQARRFLLGLGLILIVSTLVSLYLEIRGIDEKYRTIAAELGRSFFQAIDTMREWNLDHGGLYMQASSDTPPNPYLAESLRSATTTDGKTLNMINHAQMTRLFSELLTNKRGIHLHISSLTPIRPDNLADAWEQHALVHFQQGSPEEFGIVREGDATVFKYMAPLRLEERCLSCHPGRDDSPEQVRGGISVSFSYAPFRKAIAAEHRQNLIVHITFFFLGIGLIALPGRKMIRSIGALQYSLLHIKRLEGFLPICAQCKRIRLAGADQGDQKSWMAVEEYIADRTDAEFTHGLCPKCAKELYPSFFRESDKHA